MPEVERDRVENTTVAVLGSGRPLLLAHGMGGPEVVLPLARLLAVRFQVLVPTFPGFRHVDGPIQYSDGLYVNFVEQLRLQFGLEQWAIAGISMGGRTVLNYAIQCGAHVSHLIAIDSLGLGNLSPLFTVPGIRHIIPRLLSTVLAFPRSYSLLGKNDIVEMDSPVMRVMIQSFTNMMASAVVRNNFARVLVAAGAQAPQWRHKLHTIHIPTLILWAEDDKTVSAKYAYELHSLISDSKMAVLPGYRHGAFLEKPAFFAQEIMGFLDVY